MHLLVGRQLALNQGISRQRSLQLGLGVSLIQDTIPAVLVGQAAARREAPVTITSTFVMPDVVGQPRKEASDALKSDALKPLKLDVAFFDVPSRIIPKGTVIGQVPTAGESLEENQRVEIAISGGLPEGLK